MKTRCLSIREFCEMVGVKRTFTYGLIRDRRVAVVKLGRRTLITRQSADELIKKSIVQD